jgi:hypothetical protein
VRNLFARTDPPGQPAETLEGVWPIAHDEGDGYNVRCSREIPHDRLNWYDLVVMVDVVANPRHGNRGALVHDAVTNLKTKRSHVIESTRALNS